MRKRLVMALALVIAALAGYLLLEDHLPAPDIRYTTLTGQTQQLGDLKGKVVLVNFWATSCAGCVEEMPRIREMYRNYAKDGFTVIAVAMNYDAPDYVKAFSDKFQLPFPVVLDTDGSIAQAFGNIQLTPTTFLIDRDGKIIKRYVGVMDFSEVRKLIERNK